MKKYILSIVVGIFLLLETTLLQAPVGIYPPDHVQLRVRDEAIEVSWNDNNGEVSNYKIYYATSSGWTYSDSQIVDGSCYWTTLDGLTNTDTYFVLVTAIKEGVESDTDVSYEKMANPAPADTSVERFIPGGTTVAAYTMISTPVEPADTRMSAVLGDYLGPYDNTQWRCFHWESDEGVYEEGASSNDMGPDPGEPIVGNSVWLISRDNVTIHSTGCVYDYNNTRDYEILLAPGWNQIACPFNFAVAWNDVEVTDGYDVYPANVDNRLCGDVAWFWNNGDYYAVINLVPMHGCFVYNKTGDDISLIVPHIEVRAVVERGYSAEGDVANYNLGRTPSYEEGKSGESPPPPPGGIVSADVSDGGGGGGCFIATAAFGTPMAEEVRALSKFRDKYLLTSPLGRDFVKVYYRTSPPIADFIRNKPLLKATVRLNVKSLIWFSRLMTK